jgi:hypothetical protein
LIILYITENVISKKQRKKVKFPDPGIFLVMLYKKQHLVVATWGVLIVKSPPPKEGNIGGCYMGGGVREYEKWEMKMQ